MGIEIITDAIIDVINKNMSFKDFMKKFMDGFAIIFKDRKIASLVLNAVLTQMFFHPFFYTVLPILFYRLRDYDLSSINFFLSYLNMHSSNNWKAMNALIQLAGSLGVLISMILTSKISDGISAGIIGISISGFIISAIVSFLKIFNISMFGFICLMFIVNIALFFFFNIFTVFFSVYYQKRVDKDKLGIFVSTSLVLFSIAGFIGSILYGYLAETGWIAPVVALILGSILKILLYLVFIYLDRKS
jgi:MFS family permease